MSHISNPLVTAEQLSRKIPVNYLPIELQDSIRYYTARLTQAAGILLRLDQDITARANVLLFRYWVTDDLMQYEFSDASAAVIYMTAKISASPRSLRSITNVYTYLSAFISNDSTAIPDPELYYLSEGSYLAFCNRLLNIEGQVLNSIGFNAHVALPHPLAITYLQTLDVFSSQLQDNLGKEVAKRTIEYLNTALLSPQMLYLTHQPCALASAAIYLAARDKGLKMPDVEWWEVFDCEREELGFLVVGMGSLESLGRRELDKWGEVRMITRSGVRAELKKLEKELGNTNIYVDDVEDKKPGMASLVDVMIRAD